MSHRALVAVKQRDGSFNVHYSHNGADEIQLLDELPEALNVHGRVDWEELTGTAMPEMGRQLAQSDFDGDFTRTGGDHVVDPQPNATNLSRDEILLATDLLRFEVLYVVDDGQVDAYWLTWMYPNVIRPWRNYIEVEVYRGGRNATSAKGMQEQIESDDPITTISDFEQGWLEDTVTRDIVRDHHRWVYEQYQMVFDQAEEHEVSPTDVPHIIQTGQYLLQTNVMDPDAKHIVASGMPFFVPIRLDPNKPPNQQAMKIREHAAETRFEIGAGLNALRTEPDEDEMVQAATDALIEILDPFTDRIATDLVPSEFGAILEQYKQGKELQRLGDLMKN